MLNLVVMSANQDLLDNFFKSLEPTMDDRIKVYAVTEGLKLPDWAIRVDRTEFHPNKYFNKVLQMLDGGYMGIVNDDIIFSEGWKEDIFRLLEKYEYICPGFIETRESNEFITWVHRTRFVTAVTRGMFDAFYIFPVEDAKFLEGFDEDVLMWYDIDWFLRTITSGAKWRTSKRITIQHLGRMSINKKSLPKRQIASQIRKKYGKSLMTVAGRNSSRLRREIYE